MNRFYLFYYRDKELQKFMMDSTSTSRLLCPNWNSVDQEMNTKNKQTPTEILRFDSSSGEKRYMTWQETKVTLKEARVKSRDIKLIEKCLEEEVYPRQIIAPRPASNSFIFFLEHIKVILSVCFHFLKFK